MRIDPSVVVDRRRFRTTLSCAKVGAFVFLTVLCGQAAALPTVFGNIVYGDFGSATGPTNVAAAAAAVQNSVLGPAPTSLSTGNLVDSYNEAANFADPLGLGTYVSSVNGSGSVGAGVIHASAMGSAQTTAGPLGAPAGASASVGDTLYWVDQITTGGPGATNLYQILLHNDVIALTASAGAGNVAHYSTELDIFDLQTNQLITSLFQCQVVTAGDNFCNNNPLYGKSGIGVGFNATNGEYLLFETFTFSGTAVQTGSPGTSTFNANLADTVYFTIDPQGTGVSYSSASGVDYESAALAVPEPSAWTMIAAGLGLLGLVACRRVRAAG